MKDFDPSRPNLELSQDELGSLHESLSKALVIRGDIAENPGVYPPDIEATAYNFTYSLPKDFVRDVFYPSDKDLIIGSGSYISYSAPHRIEPEDSEVIDVVFLSLDTRIAGTDITSSESAIMRHARGLYEASFDTEYFKDDMRISPNDVSHSMDIKDPQAVMRVLEDHQALIRPLDLEDAEKLRKIEELITAS